MPKLLAVERDDGAVYEKWVALGPLVEKARDRHEGRVLWSRPKRSPS